ncbi:HAD-like domain containing protein [Parasponia andersonii]|uniref:HAD-like domain containing protein n=1 Tax=Parasponia andersonii TaxID=3476 RepID=A0A2P5C6Y9_PARAD|nr:HAD-like domain containing protein [Parasponia andersonii]
MNVTKDAFGQHQGLRNRILTDRLYEAVAVSTPIPRYPKSLSFSPLKTLEIPRIKTNSRMANSTAPVSARGLITHVIFDMDGLLLGLEIERVFFDVPNIRLGGPIDSDKIIVFEDAPSGVKGAKNGGMFVIMVPDPRLNSSLHGPADQVLNSLLDFNPSEWGLPPFDDATN